eukprot:992608-Amphidinium_carterae.2
MQVPFFVITQEWSPTLKTFSTDSSSRFRKRLTQSRILCIVSEKRCRCRRSCFSSVRVRSKNKLAKSSLNRREKRPEAAAWRKSSRSGGSAGVSCTALPAC